MWYKSLYKGLVICLTLTVMSFAQAGGRDNPGGAGPTNSGNTTIRFMPFWTNTSAIMIIDGKEITMTAVEDYCGWFEAKTDKKDANFTVRFKQTIGNIYVGGEGSEEVATGALPVTEELSLDSVAALGNTIWVRGYENDAPEVTSEYPNVLGDCPLRNISVMMFDWLHGSKKDGTFSVRTRNGVEDTTFNNGAKELDPEVGLGSPYAFGFAVSDDFGSGGCSSSPMRGMVQKDLGPKGVPVRATPFPEKCTITEHLDYWFLPVVAGQDAAGNVYTNAACRDLAISLDDEGFWLAEISKDRISKGNEVNRGGMFLLDDFKFLDEGGTVPNPFYDNLPGGSDNGRHNFGFTMKFQAKFVYVPGQYFEFLGDDDVWVFINKKLVVDIGGQHAQVAGSVNLDTLGLTPGETYPFHIFYAERHQSSSNFKMRTSMDLHTDASMFLTWIQQALGVKDYNIWSINKKDVLNCDFDADQTKTDTTGGPSTYRFVGSTVDEEFLPGHTYHAGIKITSDTTFTIDSVKIVDESDLPPGHYFLEITLKSKGSQKKRVEIIVPGNAPAIAYADENWKLIGDKDGLEVVGNQATIGKWAYEMYKVNVTFKDKDVKWTKYNKTIKIAVDNPLVFITDENGKSITSVALDSIDKHATFYVMANGNVAGANLTITGSGNVKAFWTNLNFTEPPIPHVKLAIISDRNGDGRGDKLKMEFDKAFDNQNVLDSLQVYFGEQFPMEKHLDASGTILTITVPGNCGEGESCGFGSKVFTGDGSDAPGTMTTYITYKESGKDYHFTIRNEPITDGIGPVVTRARKTIDGTKHILDLTVSEPIDGKFSDDMLQFKSQGELKLPTSRDHTVNGSKLTLVYVSQGAGEYVPEVGDIVRFTPAEDGGTVAEDKSLLKNKPHLWNQWVPITGDQATTTTSPGVVLLNNENPIVKSDSATQPMRADSNLTAKQIADSLGVQGNLIGFTLASLVNNKTTEEVATLQALIERYMKDSVVTINKISEDVATLQLFEDIRNDQLGQSNLSEDVVAGIMAGVITASNYKTLGLSNDDMNTIAELVQEAIDLSRDTVVTYPYATEQSVLDSIASGAISAEKLEEYGISNLIINSIKSGNLNASNIDEFAKGLTSVIKPEEIVLRYRTHYYSHLGHYINGEAGSFTCADEGIYGEGKNCLTNSGNIFLAWNMRSSNGKLVGTGVYISRLEYTITVAGEVIKESVRDFLMGVRRGKAVQHEIDVND